MQTTLGIMHANVKVGESGVPFGIQKNVIRFDVTVGC
jgi:hypothetical protein